MPFYIDHTTKQRTVTLEDIDDTQFIICLPEDEFGNPLAFSIILEAYLNDTFNLRNTILEWEQIYGNTVVIVDSSILKTQYPFIDKGDKIFRFWIHRYTGESDYLDIKIYHTPVSLYGTGNISTQSKLKNFSATAVTYSLIAGLPPISGTYIPRVDGAIVIKLNYSAPTNLGSLAGLEYKLEIYYSNTATINPNTLLATFYPPYPTEYETNTDSGFYKIVSYYFVNGVYLSFDSDLIVVIIKDDDLALVSGLIIGTDEIAPIPMVNKRIYSYRRYSFVGCNENNTIGYIYNGNTSSIKSFVKLSNITCDNITVNSASGVHTNPIRDLVISSSTSIGGEI